MSALVASVDGAITVELPPRRVTRPAARRRRTFSLPLTRTGARKLALTGRIAAVWLSVYAVVLSDHVPLGRSLSLTTLLAVVWLVTVSQAFGAGTTPLLGPACGAAVGTVVGLVATSALALWLHQPAGASALSVRSLLEMALAVWLFSWAWERTVRGSVAARLRVLIVTADDAGHDLAETLATRTDLPFDLAGIVDAADADLVGHTVEEERPDIVVLAVDELRIEMFERLLDAAGAGFRVVTLAEFYEHAFGRVPLETVRPGWFVNVLHLYHRPYPQLAKRVFDIVAALIGVVLTAWLWPVIALAVRLTPGPILYRQTRLGQRGKPFTIYKFRTMRADAESMGAVWALENDPRVTKLGRFLRKTRLDELPQLMNVLRGEMSIVGPRPERPEFLEQLEAAVPFWTRRHLVKPGITGWAQVRCGYASDTDSTARKLSYDLWYLRHRCLVVDLAVCVKTLGVVLSHAGAR